MQLQQIYNKKKRQNGRWVNVAAECIHSNFINIIIALWNISNGGDAARPQLTQTFRSTAAWKVKRKWCGSRHLSTVRRKRWVHESKNLQHNDKHIHSLILHALNGWMLGIHVSCARCTQPVDYEFSVCCARCFTFFRMQPSWWLRPHQRDLYCFMILLHLKKKNANASENKSHRNDEPHSSVLLFN